MSVRIINSDKNGVFADLASAGNRRAFVDKTDFVEKTINLLDTDTKFQAFANPRRFGKTVTVSMLTAFYSCGCDSRELFYPLKIKKFLNKHG